MRSVSSFNAVALSGIGEVTLKQGADESGTIVADDNLTTYLTMEVRDGVLYPGSWTTSARRLRFRD